MHDKELKELFEGMLIVPDPEAKRKAKERMLAASLKKEKINMLRRTSMQNTQDKNTASDDARLKESAQSEAVDTNTIKIAPEPGKKPQKNKGNSFWQKIKPNKYHWQGAAAMLLVVTITISALALTPGVNLFGTLFKGYEDAQQVALTTFPAQIEARADFNEETFTLYGLPEDELGNIKPEHIYLGGYFGGMSITGIETVKEEGEASAINVTVNSTPSENSNDGAVDWEDYAGGNGLIAFTPEAFKSQSSYYQAEVGIVYPETECNMPFIYYDPDTKFAEKIKIHLKNDVFTKTPTSEEIIISGGIAEPTVSDVSIEGQILSFTLNGVLDDSFDGIAITLSSEILEKGLYVSTFIQKGSVPEVAQSSSLWVTKENSKAQTLDIFVYNDTWISNVDFSMLDLGGIMTDLSVTSLELVNDQTLRIQLNGAPPEGEGTIMFSKGAFTSGRIGLAANIKAAKPTIQMDEFVPTAAENPVISFQTDYYSEETPDLKFEFGGALSGVSVSDWEWLGWGASLKLSGKVKSGPASIKVSGLFESEAEFELYSAPATDLSENALPVSSNFSNNELQFMNLIADSNDLQIQNLAAGGIDITAPTRSGLGSLANMWETASTQATNKNIAEAAATSALKSVAFSPASILKSMAGSGASAAVSALMPVLLDALGYKDAYTLALEDVQERLDEIDEKLDGTSSQITLFQEVMISEFKNLDYQTKLTSLKADINLIRNYFQDFLLAQSMGENTPEQKEAKLSMLYSLTNLTASGGTTTRANQVVDAINNIISELDPGTLSNENKDSLTYKYFQSLITATPFMHNATHLMNVYSVQWNRELSVFKTLLGAICKYNSELYPKAVLRDGRNYYMGMLEEKEAAIKNAVVNIQNILPPEYKKALELMQPTENTVTVNRPGTYWDGTPTTIWAATLIEEKNKLLESLRVTVNKSGTSYHFGNMGTNAYRYRTGWGQDIFYALARKTTSGYVWTYPIPEVSTNSSNIQLLNNFGLAATATSSGQHKSGINDFFKGGTSVFDAFGTGMTFNQFMMKYLDGNANWWNPDYILTKKSLSVVTKTGIDVNMTVEALDCNTSLHKFEDITKGVKEGETVSLVGVEDDYILTNPSSTSSSTSPSPSSTPSKTTSSTPPRAKENPPAVIPTPRKPVPVTKTPPKPPIVGDPRRRVAILF